jgi:hypothetical protein
MSGFLYWIPIDRSTNSAALLKRLAEAGLAYAFDDRLTSRTCDKGPDGARGVTVIRGGNEDNALGYWPERQRWRQVPGMDIWCGVYADAMPTPRDVERDDQVPGQWLKLDDGQQWLAPTARRWVPDGGELAWTHGLPQRLTLSDEGTWVTGGVKPKYQRLWDLSVRYLTATEDEDGIIRFTVDELNDLAISALQVNYRVGPIELDMLGVFDETARRQVIRALLDLQTLDEWIAKKNAGGLGGGST